MKYSKYLLAFIILLIIGSSLDAKELRKDIYRTFEISSKGTIEISNSYGNVFIIESDDDKVHFDIEIIAKGKIVLNLIFLLKQNKILKPNGLGVGALFLLRLCITSGFQTAWTLRLATSLATLISDQQWTIYM